MRALKSFLKTGWIASLFIGMTWLHVSTKNHDLPLSHLGQDVAGIVKAMPKKDKQQLELFFRTLIEKNSFGYVLVGQKPMAFDDLAKDINVLMCAWDDKTQQEDPSDELSVTLFDKLSYFTHQLVSEERINFLKGFETWKKYETLFPSRRFCFIYHVKRHFGSEHLQVALVNKNAFIDHINKYKTAFTDYLDKTVSGEEFLTKLVTSQNLDPVMNHQALLGTLLGFGIHNAFLFHQQDLLKTNHEKQRFKKKHHLDFVWGQQECVFQLDQGSGLTSLELPCFIADTTSIETAQLKRSYQEDKEKLIAYYKNKDFLEATLLLLTSPENPT